MSASQARKERRRFQRIAMKGANRTLRCLVCGSNHEDGYYMSESGEYYCVDHAPASSVGLVMDERSVARAMWRKEAEGAGLIPGKLNIRTPVSERDRNWLEENPDRTNWIRRRYPDEVDIPGGDWIYVHQLKPGLRVRVGILDPIRAGELLLLSDAELRETGTKILKGLGGSNVY